MTDLEALVVAAYVFADEYPAPARCGRRPLVEDAELVALSVAQAAIGISSDRQFLGLIGRVLPGWFPHLPDQSQYNRRLPWPGRADLDRAAAAGAPAPQRRRPPQRRHPGRRRQLPRLPTAQRVRRLRPLRLREVTAPLRLRRPARAADRQPRAAARLHPGARQREGGRAARRPAP